MIYIVKFIVVLAITLVSFAHYLYVVKLIVVLAITLVSFAQAVLTLLSET